MSRRIKKGLYVSGLLIVLFIAGGPAFFPYVYAAAPAQSIGAADTVDSIAVKIILHGTSSEKIVRRVSTSVKTIGEHVLQHRKISNVVEQKESHERTIKEVFDRVLVGYTVKNVAIVAGVRTEILVELLPWGDSVTEVKTQIDYAGFAKDAIPSIEQDVSKMEGQIQEALIGLPVDAVEWAGGVAREIISEILKNQLPEFHFSLDIQPAAQTIVRITLFPTAPVVRETHTSFHSSSVPNILVIHARPAVEEIARKLRGLPVAFVERKLQAFQAQVRDAVNQDIVVRKLGLKAEPLIKTGLETIVDIAIETNSYRISGEAYLDMGRAKDNFSGKGHVGRRIGSADEVFFEIKLTPGTMVWDFMPGWGHDFGQTTSAGYRYRMGDQQHIVWITQGLGPRWSLRAERIPGLSWNEVALRYRLHDFLSAEFVINNDMNWLRLVGHL